jgi:hypothetical protein
MRHAGKFLCCLGAIALGVLGCRSPQPNLKPPEGPEVLAKPDDNDKRFSEPTQYPPDVLANDPIKKSLNQQNPIVPVKGPRPMMPGAPGY